MYFTYSRKAQPLLMKTELNSLENKYFRMQIVISKSNGKGEPSAPLLCFLIQDLLVMNKYIQILSSCF